MNLSFSSHHLIIGDNNFPQIKDLVKACCESCMYTVDNTEYRVNIKKTEDQYLWFYIQHGAPNPYTNKVLNTESGTEEKNPREKHQVEINQQIFGLFFNQELYLSNKYKKAFLQSFLKKKLKKDVIIKNFYKSPQEFLEAIHSVKSVKFVTKRNLFTENSGIMDIFPNPKDVYALGIPENFTLEANFYNAKITAQFKQRLSQMVKWKQRGVADSLICIGTDDKGMESVFNVDTFEKKISISEQKNDHGFFDEASVKQKIITKVKEQHEKNT